MPDTDDAATNAAIEDAVENVEAAEEADTEESSEEADTEESTEEAAESDSGEGEAKPSSRRENRVQKLANELKEEREARIRAEARAEERERARTTYTDPNEAARVRQAKMELMEPAERENFLMKEEIQTMKRDQMIAQIKTEDAMDKREYASKASTNPVYAKHAEKVEKILADMRRAGNNAPRETVLKYVIGEAALTAPPKKQVAKEKAAAEERVNTAKAKSASARMEGSAKKGDDSLEALKARIEAQERAAGNR